MRETEIKCRFCDETFTSIIDSITHICRVKIESKERWKSHVGRNMGIKIKTPVVLRKK